MAGYHYLIASLDEYTLSGDSKQLDFLAIRQEILDNVSGADRAKITLLLTFWDIQNLLNVLENRPSQYSLIGNYTQKEISELARQYNDLVALRSSESELEQSQSDLSDDQKSYDVTLSPVFRELFKVLTSDSSELDSSSSVDVLLLTIYYRHLSKSGSCMLSKWGDFDRTIRNISAAYESRRRGLEISKSIIGEGEVVEALTANSRDDDFGLSEIDWIAELIKTISGNDILKKERGLDLIRWNWIDEVTTYEYFNLNYVLGYLIKITLISRWLLLDEKQGREMFRRMVEQISGSGLIKAEE